MRIDGALPGVVWMQNITPKVPSLSHLTLIIVSADLLCTFYYITVSQARHVTHEPTPCHLVGLNLLYE